MYKYFILNKGDGRKSYIHIHCIHYIIIIVYIITYTLSVLIYMHWWWWQWWCLALLSSWDNLAYNSIAHMTNIHRYDRWVVKQHKHIKIYNSLVYNKLRIKTINNVPGGLCSPAGGRSSSFLAMQEWRQLPVANSKVLCATYLSTNALEVL